MYTESENNKVLQEDLEFIADNTSDIEKLKGKSVFITGATGLVGSNIVKSLACCNRKLDLGIKLILLVRSPEKAKDVYGRLAEREDITFVTGDITNSYSDYLPKEQNIDIIIHAASVTASKIMVEKPVETISTALRGTENMLELAKEKKVGSFIYISSMEVYGSFSDEAYVSEKDMGYIDPITVRSNYPLCKRMCENMCIAYYTEYGIPVRIARLAQTFGAGILKGENRVFAQFARSAINGTDIVLHTKGLSEGNYCYTRDMVAGILSIIFNGTDGEAYNVSNEAAHTTISAMAEMVAAKIAGGKIKVTYDIPESNKFGYAADTKMKLNNQKLRKLGWEPTIDLEEAYKRLIESLKESEG